MTRVIYFGTTGRFSRPPLERLLAAGLDLQAVVLAAASAASGQRRPRRLEPPQLTRWDLPIVNPHLESNILHLAWAESLPVWGVGSLSAPETLEMLAELQPDLIVVACFTLIFPPALLQLPRFGCLNLHPSLLPAYRGPVPLFWIARQGDLTAGVTLHLMDERLDSGDIVAQSPLEWPEGLSGLDFEHRCAVEGGRLAVAAIQALDSTGKLPHRPQPELGRSYFGWPDPADFIISTDWPAQRAFRFLRVVDEWPLVIEVAGERFSIRRAVGYETDQTLGQPYLIDGDEVSVQLSPGVLRVQIG